MKTTLIVAAILLGLPATSDLIYNIPTNAVSLFYSVEGYGESPATGDCTRSTEVLFEGKRYGLRYEYNNRSSSIPLVEGAKAHYKAKIIVTIHDPHTEITIQDGTYVPGGCFDDVPVEWVKRALAMQKERFTVTGTAITNVFSSILVDLAPKWTPEFIKKLASDGTICEVMDHVWVDGRKPLTHEEMIIATQPVWIPPRPDDSKPHRHCRFCGRVEVKSEEWKEKK